MNMVNLGYHMHIVFKPGVLIRSSFEVVSDHMYTYTRIHAYIHRYRVSSLHKLEDRYIYILAFANKVPVFYKMSVSIKCPIAHARTRAHAHTRAGTHTNQGRIV
jgi:hypothetical protein